MYKNPYAKLEPPTRKPYTEVYLIRHCHPDYNLEKKVGEYNMPLSKIGLRQRRTLTKKLLTLKIDRVYMSGLKRAQETAEDFLNKSRKKPIIDLRLDEIHWSHWHRMKYFNMAEETRNNKLKNRLKLDRQLDKMQTAVRRAFADIIRQGKGKRIAVFAHGNLIKTLLTGILNADVIGFLSLEIFQSSISKILIDRNGYVKISYINDASHLPTLPQRDLYITLKD
ncbi:MAG: histidine phosphatase family protein [Patescibacteria group bacterium]